MIVKVKIDEQVYEVEIDDLHQRPILAVIEGEEFEVWPVGEPTIHARPPGINYQVMNSPQASDATPQTAPRPTPAVKSDRVAPSETGGNSLSVVRAPIPGVITAISTQAGAEVAAGQQLCVLEAMKMNNSIRASRAGRIAAIHISIGQHVKHNDILLEYAD